LALIALSSHQLLCFCPAFIMPGIIKTPQTLYDKVFNDHIVDEKEDGTILLYIGAIPMAT